MADNVIFLTKEGLVKLEQELEYLKTSKRLEIAEKLKEAMSFGDLSENSEYEDARNEQAQVEARIIELEEQLKNVEIIEEDKKGKDDKVKIGSIISLQNLSSEEKEKVEYKIVGSTEANIFDNPPKISNESPIGSAIIGKKKGDKVKVNAPSKKFEYKILDIK